MKFTKISVVVCSLALLSGSAIAASSQQQLNHLQQQINSLNKQVSNLNQAAPKAGASNVLSLNGTLSSQMLSNYAGVGREMNILKARQNGSLANQTLTVGGMVQADAFYAHTNSKSLTTGAFSNPIATTTGAHPNNYAQYGSSHLALSNAKLATTATLNDWVAGYVQLGAYNIGETSSNNVGTSTPNIQAAYLVLGNLAQSPMYGFAGRKEIDFGNFSTIDLYSQPLTRTMFMATGNTAGIGYNAHGFNLDLSLVNGGDQRSTLITTTSTYQYANLYTANANGINNYALNATYNGLNQGINWTVGAGYLNGARPEYSTSQNSPYATNGAWDVNGKASINNVDLLAEYVSTVHAAPSLFAYNGLIPTVTTNFPNAKIQAWSLGGDYNFMTSGYKSVAGLEYSAFTQGASAWNAYQYVASYRIQPVANVWTGIEYAYSRGVWSGGVARYTGADPHFALNSGPRDYNITLDITAMF